LDLPLYGLLEDALFPGEERAVGAPSLDGAHRRALAKAVGSDAAFVTVTATMELPALVAGRFATEARVVRAEGDAFVLRGLRRVKIAKATRQEPPYLAEAEPREPEAAPDGELAQALAALASAFGSGATPEGGAARLADAASALLRAALPPQELAGALRKPLVETLREAAALVAARAPAFRAEAKLEQVARQLQDCVAPAQRRRLWSQVVELERKLDVYDPASAAEADDLGRLERRLRQAGLPAQARDTAKRELRLLRSTTGHNPEAPTYLAHLDLMARLPWHPSELPPVDLAKVQAVLDRDHAGMEKVKRRVMEYLAVRALGGTSQSTVLCLVGPPGTGKTTIARSMAEALGRPFARLSLGGVHDQAELRGHRLTYIAACEGRFVQAIAQAGSQNALLLLDEIDKLGTDRSRNAGGALLEALDPEQHAHFVDHFLGVPFDLSHVMFVCTANDASLVDPTLADRLEKVELDGYSLEEKVLLARTHLLPRVAAETAVGAPPPASDELLVLLVEGYTREAGLRQLRQKLSALLRARALAKVRDGTDPSVPLTREEVERVLGPPRTPRRPREESLPPGTAYGLSVGGDGGSLLPVEVVRLPGRGKLQLTGRLGEVLRESVRAVHSHLRHAHDRYGLAESAFASDLHVHLPDAATPKDGPSAGVALAVAMAGALSGRAARADAAFTGELTLGGRVTAVGGVRAKVLAAERAQMRTVVLPEENRTELPAALRVSPRCVSRLEEAMAEAFEGRMKSEG